MKELTGGRRRPQPDRNRLPVPLVGILRYKLPVPLPYPGKMAQKFRYAPGNLDRFSLQQEKRLVIASPTASAGREIQLNSVAQINIPIMHVNHPWRWHNLAAQG